VPKTGGTFTDVNKPKEPVGAFGWFQRDVKRLNAITDPAITTQKDKTQVSTHASIFHRIKHALAILAYHRLVFSSGFHLVN
jgi:hypothetical protein